ncbi:RNA-guided endonuclease InsQ/TnpB family protein, partial [Actinomadura sp. 6N118]|uniref:RNA-guided endonuclease InsQ/TnpB family protein n=1 Tax=Actinomadura sp. 6N118 TaxID=3375151 RepID=UPI0037B98626
AGRAWFRPEYTTGRTTGRSADQDADPDGGGVFTATPEDLALARRLAEQALRTDHPFPNLSRVRTMLFDGPIAQRQTPADATHGGSFAWWLRISRLPGTGAPVRIPLQTSRYFDAQPGELSSMVQVTVSDGDGADDGEVTIKLIKTSGKSEPRAEGSVVGLDWGLCSLLTTSDGQRLGQALYSWLRARDAELATLQARLSQQGIRFRDSKRWRNLTKRIRGHVENEVGRIINRLTERDIAELVVEDLDFRGKGLSRELRRIVSRAGRAVLKRRLAALTEDHGIAVTVVNPAHTSRQCSGCGYTDARNRPTQNRFRCGFCGKTLHADINAARAIAARRSCPSGLTKMTRDAVLAYLDHQFTQHWGTGPAEHRQRHQRAPTVALPQTKQPFGCGPSGIPPDTTK